MTDKPPFILEAAVVPLRVWRRLDITFEPQTIEDQEIMNSYGGLDNTPLYLIRLRPVLTTSLGWST